MAPPPWTGWSRRRSAASRSRPPQPRASGAVTVGAPGTETPLGAFAVTDAVAGPKLGPYYGCCVLALSGHQPNLPQGWIGGDRMAVHGTPGRIGVAESAGCLRTSDEAMVGFFARVPLGAPVYVRA